ncbi:MAG: response regulator transcription factor [Candidatus Coprenecus sp.]|nr:response regulator transcription factor [Candidatus Coprenecus sp.]
MTANHKRVLIITPSRIVAEGLITILTQAGGFTIERVIASISRENENLLHTIPADIIIVDPSMFGFNILQTLKNRLSEFTTAPLVSLSTMPMSRTIAANFDEQISMFDTAPEIVKKLRNITIVDTSNSEESQDNNIGELTSREKEILVKVASGHSNKQIADQLNLSVHTVITHRKNITHKTGIKTIAGLTVYALLNNLITTPNENL